MDTLSRLMMRKQPPLLVCYGGALLIVAACYSLRVLFEGRLEGYAFLQFYPALAVSAVLFDRGAGYFATLLSAVLAAYFLIPPYGTFHLDTGGVIALLIFIPSGLAFAFLIEHMRHLLVRLAAAEQQKDLLFRELAHRTQNHFAAIASILQLQAAGQPEPVRNALEAASGRVQVIAQTNERLRRGRGDQPIADSRALLADLRNQLEALFQGVRPITLDLDAESADLDQQQTLAIGLIVNELVTNAIKYAFPDGRAGRIAVTFRRAGGDSAELLVEDDGVGCPATGHRGLGTALVESLAGQLSGTVAREHDDRGCRVRLSFPLSAGGASAEASADRFAPSRQPA